MSRKAAGGLWTGTDASGDPTVKSGISTLGATAAHLAQGPAKAIATNIRLIGVCMQALPDLLTGVQPDRFSNTYLFLDSMYATSLMTVLCMTQGR